MLSPPLGRRTEPEALKYTYVHIYIYIYTDISIYIALRWAQAYDKPVLIDGVWWIRIGPELREGERDTERYRERERERDRDWSCGQGMDTQQLSGPVALHVQPPICKHATE